MNWLDYLIIIIYLGGFLGMGYFFKENKNSSDYFLGGKSMGWFPLSLSAMATQLSAISFVSAPAFVALKSGGGMKWISFEFSVPLAMLFLMILVVPPLFRSGVVSIYEFVERRFDASTRMILSLVFQISRSLSTGVMVYTIAIILQAVLEIDFIYTILIISVVTIVYSWQGGMKAVVWGDAIQMILLFGGLVICLGYGYFMMVENGGTLANVDPERFKVIQHNFGLGDGGEYGLWPMIIGGFFLYASYYGCDQTQAQRILSAKDEKTARTLLFANGMLRLPVVLVYCTMGLVLAGFLMVSPDFMTAISATTQKYFPAEFAAYGAKTDLMLPVYIIKYMPHGIIGIMMVAILSAAMSTLSSTVNSLSAVTVEDFFNRGTVKLTNVKYMVISKAAVIFWGGVCIGSAFLFGASKNAVIEIINSIGSVFYGPVLATFILAIFSKKVNKYGIKAGIIISVLINLIFSKTMQEIFGFHLNFEIFWIWLNFTGFGLCIAIAYLVSSIFTDKNNKAPDVNFKIQKADLLTSQNYILVAFFLAIIVFSYYLPQIFG